MRRLAAFKQGLSALGWTEGRNLQVDTRWAVGDVNRAAAFAKELVALQPEVILSNTTSVTAALHRETRSVPLVFVIVSDPIGSGFVESLSRPGSNVTGFINLESSLVEKWLELLKEIAPRVSSVAVMFNPQTAPYAEYYLQPFEVAAPKFGVKPFKAAVRSEADIETVVAGLGREADGGLIAMTDSYLTMQHKVPSIYFLSEVPSEGIVTFTNYWKANYKAKKSILRKLLQR